MHGVLTVVFNSDLSCLHTLQQTSRAFHDFLAATPALQCASDQCEAPCQRSTAKSRSHEHGAAWHNSACHNSDLSETCDKTISPMPSRICPCVVSAEAEPCPDRTLEKPTPHIPVCSTEVASKIAAEVLEGKCMYSVHTAFQGRLRKVLHKTLSTIHAVVGYLLLHCIGSVAATRFERLPGSRQCQ